MQFFWDSHDSVHSKLYAKYDQITTEPVARDISGLKLGSCMADSKSVLSNSIGLQKSFLYKTGFTHSQLFRLQVLTKLEASRTSKRISAQLSGEFVWENMQFWAQILSLLNFGVHYESLYYPKIVWWKSLYEMCSNDLCIYLCIFVYSNYPSIQKEACFFQLVRIQVLQ